MKFLSREDMLGAAAPEPKPVDVPGGRVFVKVLSSDERDDWELWCTTENGRDRKMNTKRAASKLVVRTTVDQVGARVFTDADAEPLSVKPGGGVLVRVLFEAACKANAIGKDAIEELVGELRAGQSAGNGSVSDESMAALSESSNGN